MEALGITLAIIIGIVTFTALLFPKAFGHWLGDIAKAYHERRRS